MRGFDATRSVYPSGSSATAPWQAEPAVELRAGATAQEDLLELVWCFIQLCANVDVAALRRLVAARQVCCLQASYCSWVCVVHQFCIRHDAR